MINSRFSIPSSHVVVKFSFLSCTTSMFHRVDGWWSRALPSGLFSALGLYFGRRRKTHHQRVQRATRFFPRWIRRLHSKGLRLHMVATSRRRLFGFAVRVRSPPRGKSGEASTAERDRAETDVVRRREPLGMQEINRRTARMAKCTWSRLEILQFSRARYWWGRGDEVCASRYVRTIS